MFLFLFLLFFVFVSTAAVAEAATVIVSFFTSIPVSSEVISFRAGYKMLRSGFLGAAAQLTHVLSKDVVKTLASDVTITLPQAHITKCCSSDLLKDVPL